MVLLCYTRRVIELSFSLLVKLILKMFVCIIVHGTVTDFCENDHRFETTLPVTVGETITGDNYLSDLTGYGCVCGSVGGVYFDSFVVGLF